MLNTKAYGILAFYGLLAILFAWVGHHLDKRNGFSNGYVVGTIVNLVLWFTVGHKEAKSKSRA